MELKLRKQNEVLNSHKRQVWWEDGYIAAAITLRSISGEAYSYLRKKVGIPLPGLSTLRKWTRNVKCAPGVLEEVFTVLRAKSQTMTIFERLTVLSLANRRKIFRPCRNLQAIMARGLASKWKKPIFYDFDSKVIRDLLFRDIRKLEERGFIVIAVVCDMGGSNQDLISVVNVSFPNPSGVKRNEFVFADVPHLIKLLRNNFLDYGIQLRSGTVIRKEPISNIIEDKELKLCPKLSDVHLNVKRSAKQKVKYA
ncbi:hypothetical protein PR048_010616, partial [Dryococelus australis]